MSIASARPRWVSTATRRGPEPAESAGVTCPSIGAASPPARAPVPAPMPPRGAVRPTPPLPRCSYSAAAERRSEISRANHLVLLCHAQHPSRGLGGTQADDTAGHVLPGRGRSGARGLGPRPARPPRRCPGRRSPTSAPSPRRGPETMAARSRSEQVAYIALSRHFRVWQAPLIGQLGSDRRHEHIQVGIGLGGVDRSRAKNSRLPATPGSRLGTTRVANQPCSPRSGQHLADRRPLQLGLPDDPAATRVDRDPPRTAA